MRVRRLAAGFLLTLLAVTGPAIAQAPGAGADEWFCAASRTANRGVCVSNPLPSRLPIFP
jgi:hypothetical protein